MNISVCKNDREYIWGQHIPLNAWYGCDELGWWFCTVHGKPENDNELELRRFNGERWIRVRENSETTRNICQWATTMRLWWTKCHWWKEEDRLINLAAKRDANIKKFENMMRHSYKRKKCGGGSLIYNGSITDYECSKNPLHDFRRCYN